MNKKNKPTGLGLLYLQYIFSITCWSVALVFFPAAVVKSLCVSLKTVWSLSTILHLLWHNGKHWVISFQFINIWAYKFNSFSNDILTECNVFQIKSSYFPIMFKLIISIWVQYLHTPSNLNSLSPFECKNQVIAPIAQCTVYTNAGISFSSLDTHANFMDEILEPLVENLAVMAREVTALIHNACR